MADSINPDTNQMYYSGTKQDLVVFCKSLNIDSGRLSSMSNINVQKIQYKVDGIIDGMLCENYFIPIKSYNQVDINGIPHLIFPQRLRYLAQQMVAGLLMLTEYQNQQQNVNEAGKLMFEQAKKQIYQMTLWNHRIPGQKFKSRTSHTLPPGFQPPHQLIEQIWSMN